MDQRLVEVFESTLGLLEANALMKGSTHGCSWFQNSCSSARVSCPQDDGWQETMTKFAGFYDLPTAWSQVFWGIVLGGIYAVMADGLLFRPYYTTVTSNDGVYTGLNIFCSYRCHVCLVFRISCCDERGPKGSSQPSSGWALGWPSEA